MQMAFWFPFEAAGLESMGSRLHWLPLLKKVSPRLPRGAKSFGLSSQLLNMPENQGMSSCTVSTLCNYVHDLLVDQNPLSKQHDLPRFSRSSCSSWSQQMASTSNAWCGPKLFQAAARLKRWAAKYGGVVSCLHAAQAASHYIISAWACFGILSGCDFCKVIPSIFWTSFFVDLWTGTIYSEWWSSPS